MKRIILSGKLWEVKYWLKMNSRKYMYVSDWIDDLNRPTVKKGKKAAVYPFPKRNPS